MSDKMSIIRAIDELTTTAMVIVDDRVAELIAKAPPLTSRQITEIARIIVRERARIGGERARLNGGDSRAA